MPERLSGAVRLLLAALVLLLAGAATAAPRIGVLTMGPGAEYWSRFGHNAVLVDANGERTVYNYGFFDFEQPGFLLRFLRGRMLYQLVALPFAQDFAYYQSEGRSLQLQWLDLDPDQARELADFLAWNARPENADYRYDYFVDNCSTRVRDALDRVLDGELLRQTRGRSRGLSYRSEALRLSAPEAWMYLGIHALLGPEADRPLSRWEESFVPQRLHDALAVATRADGRPLVAERLDLLPQRLPPARVEEPRFTGTALLLGLGLAIVALVGARRRGVVGVLARSVLGLHWLLVGVIGLLALLLWLGTDHRMAWENRNLLLFTPWSLLLLAALPALRRDAVAARWLRVLAGLSAMTVVVFIAVSFLPLSERLQDGLEWLLLAGPLQLVAWLLLRRRGEGETTG
jgi:hypothetical protein